MIFFVEVLLDALDEVTRIPFTLAGDDHNVFRIYHNSLHTVSILVLLLTDKPGLKTVTLQGKPAGRSSPNSP